MSFDQSPCVSSPNGSPDPDSGMWWFRLCVRLVYACVCEYLVCVFMCDISASPVVMCQNMTSWAVIRNWLLCGGIKIHSTLLGRGGKCRIQNIKLIYLLFYDSYSFRVNYFAITVGSHENLLI